MKITTRSLITIGTVCNINCKHCYYHKSKRSWKPLLWNLLHICLIRLCRMNKIDISGGEPTIYPHIRLLVRFCLLLGFREVRLVTNGTQIEQALGLRVMSDKVRFSVSLHSQNRADMAALTGRDDAFDSVVRFIEMFRPAINYINCVVTPVNTEISSLWKLAKIACGIPICFKQLDYNFGHGFGTFPVSSWMISLRYAIRSMPATQPIDLRFFPFCVVGKELIDSGTVRMCSAITNSYDPMDWNPVISSRTPLRQYLRFVFGSEKTREKVTLEQAAIISQRECRHVATCQQCKYLDKCDGTQIGYLKVHGADELKAVLK